MKKWIFKSIRRLFELYEQHVLELQREVVATNRSLGSLHPEKTRLRPLTREQFESVLLDPKSDAEAVGLWVQRIIRGHEHEFQSIQAAG